MTVSLKATLGATSCDAINKYQQVAKQVSEGLGTRLPSQVFKGHLCKTPLKLSPKFLLGRFTVSRDSQLPIARCQRRVFFSTPLRSAP